MCLQLRAQEVNAYIVSIHVNIKRDDMTLFKAKWDWGNLRAFQSTFRNESFKFTLLMIYA